MSTRFWLGCAAAAAVLASLGPPPELASASPAASGVRFDDRPAGRIVVSADTYRLTLSKRNGKILGIVDRRSGARVLRDTNRCLWGAMSSATNSYIGGCSFTPRGARRFSYRWNRAAATLTLRYRAPLLGDVTVTVQPHPAYFDLRMTLVNRGGVRSRITFPDGLTGDVGTVEAGYAPNVLPGVRLGRGFFSRVGNDIEIYPSRWAFADYLALDAGGGHLSLYSVSTGPLHPVQLGFVHLAAPSPCSAQAFCLVHEFQTWVRRGTTWESPIVRIRVGLTTEQSILDYRHDNRIDAYPSLASKLGDRLSTLAAAPLIKANLQLLKPFAGWSPDLRRLPTPVLLHPVAFTLGGHDASDPDFLPPDPRFGSDADFAAMIGTAHALGDLVMPYVNLSWWDPASPTMRNLPPPFEASDVAVLDGQGQPVSIAYGDHTGLIVSPFAPFVRQRVAQELEQWRNQVPADCVFFDQLGARPWLRDFNPASPDPIAYDDGWLALMAPYADRCLMVEDGWDRLARDFTGFHGSLLMMERELDLPNAFFGEGNWEPYPLAGWLFHDKVLLYQHDLYDGTMATDGEVLLWNMAFGMVSSFSWDGDASLASPWLELAARLQRDVGPHYAGVELTSYRTLAPQVTESRFGDLTVVANWNADAGYSTAGYDLAPKGFLARTGNGEVLAGAFSGAFNGFALSPGTHYLITERTAATVTVRQPVGADSDVAVTPPASWPPGDSLHATALGADGAALGAVTGETRDGRFVFHYADRLSGRPVTGYRVAVG